MNMRKSKTSKPGGKRISLAKQVMQLRRELRAVKSERDALAKQLAKQLAERMRPEIDAILSEAGDPRKYFHARPTIREIIREAAGISNL